FEVRAARAASATALIFEGASISYGELNRRANRLAHHLRALGVGPEIRVCLLLERSPEMIVGMLAILKAGGVYVPLDPTYPRERLRFMIEDAKPVVLLTHPELASILPETETEVLFVGEREQAPLPDLLGSQTPEINQEPEARTSQEEELAPAHSVENAA